MANKIDKKSRKQKNEKKANQYDLNQPKHKKPQNTLKTAKITRNFQKDLIRIIPTTTENLCTAFRQTLGLEQTEAALVAVENEAQVAADAAAADLAGRPKLGQNLGGGEPAALERLAEAPYLEPDLRGADDQFLIGGDGHFVSTLVICLSF